MKIDREWLGKAAGWRAFQDGRKMLTAGRVLEVEREGDFFSGLLQSSPRPRRVRVRIAGPTDVETHCSCPDNRRDGAFCGHAVALVLAALEGNTAGPQDLKQVPGISREIKAPAGSSQPPRDKTNVSDSCPTEFHHEVQLRGCAVEALKRGRPLSLSLRQVDGPADEVALALRAWMEINGLETDREHPLVQVKGRQLEELLEALRGSDSVRLGDGVLALPNSLCQPAIRLELPATWILEGERDGWIALEDRWWHIGDLCWQAGPRRTGLNDRLIEDWRAESLMGTATATLAELAEDFTFVGEELSGLQWQRLAPRIRIELEGSGGYLEALPLAVYAEHGETPILDSQALPPWPMEEGTWGRFYQRDTAAEATVVEFLESAGFRKDAGEFTLRLRGEESVIDFLAAEWDAMEARGWQAVPSRTLSKILSKIDRIQPRIRPRGPAGDWLEIEVDYPGSSGKRFSAGEIRDVLRRGSRKLKTAEGKLGIIDQRAVADLDQLLEESQPRQTRAGHYQVAAVHATSLLRAVGKEGSAAEIRPGEEDFAAVDAIAASLNAQLRPYQRYGSAWLWSRCRRPGGALLADDMGLGKTLQSIVLLLVAKHAGAGFRQAPAVVVAPTSLLTNWQDELSRFAPGLSCLLWHGSGREDRREDIDGHDLILTSYGVVARDRALFRQREWSFAILDEASLIRNPAADISKACHGLKARARVAITGTPVENSVRDLWSAFEFILPGYLGPRKSFAERYEKTCAESPPDPAALRRLRLRVSPHLLRRVKEEVATELPPKQESIVWCGLSQEQNEVYQRLIQEGHEAIARARRERGEGGARLQTLTTLLRLRQCCCDLQLTGLEAALKMTLEQRSLKLDRLLSILRELRNNKHKILIFSQFTSQLDTLEKLLTLEGAGYCRLDGSTRNRGEVVREFQSENGPECFLISLKAGGYGLNLTRADVVIHLDPWWNPAAERQATDRAHRIGQSRPVNVYKFITRGTVEEKILRLQETKQQAAGGIFAGAASSDGPSGIEDLEGLLEH